MYKNKVIVVIVFTIISFFVFRHFVMIGPRVVEMFSSSVLYPLLRIQKCIVEPITMWMERRVIINELEASLEHMRKEYERIFAENIALKSMDVYARETSELREYHKKYALRNACIAQVLARHFSDNNHFFLVDAGALQGIKKDMVALYCNAIVGRVTQVYPWYCKVSLITDVDCKVASCVACSVDEAAKNTKVFASTLPKKSLPNHASADLSDKTLTKSGALCRLGASGIHEGLNTPSLSALKYVSHLESVAINDLIISSGEGLVFPRGFALGTVVAADKGE